MATEPEEEAKLAADELGSLATKLEAGAIGPPPAAGDHLAFTVLAGAGAGPEKTFAALARLRTAFVDWNDLRFSRVGDLADLLHGFPEPETAARALRGAYRRQFDESGRMDLQFPDDARAADVKKRLAKLFPCLGRTALALILYEHLPGQPLPLSDKAFGAAKKHGLCPRGGQRAQLQKRLEDALTPAEIVRLAQLLEMDAGESHPYGEPWPEAPAPDEAKKKAKKRK